MKKLRGKKGFTLTEMLISVMLLGFMSIMVTVMTTAIFSTTVTMREVAQAEILGSEALDNMQGRLRVAQSVTVDGGNVKFNTDSANTDYSFGVKDGKIIMGKWDNGVLVGDLLFSGVSYGNLSVSDLHFTGDKTSNTVEIAVAISFGDKTLWHGSVTVKPLNGIKTSTV